MAVLEHLLFTSGEDTTTTDTSNTPKLFSAMAPICPEDLQALSEFLRARKVKSERDLQRLFQRHPGIVGALGFCEFVTEYPVYKRDEKNEKIPDKKRRDRIDVLAAKGTATVDTEGEPHKSAHIIELKAAHLDVLERGEGFRPSSAAHKAVSQLGDYFKWLEMEDNQRALRNFGWNVWEPMKILVMGTRKEFEGNPGQLDAIRERFLKERCGIRLYLVDELLEKCEEARLMQKQVPIEYLLNLRAPSVDALPVILATYGLSGLVLECCRITLDKQKNWYGNIDVIENVPEGLAHIEEKRLQPIARKLRIPYAEALIGFREHRGEFGKAWWPVKSGIVVAEPDAPAIREVLKRRTVEKVKRFARAVRRHFPKLPAGVEFRIAEWATVPDAGRVGLDTSMPMRARVWLAVEEYAEWNYRDNKDWLDALKRNGASVYRGRNSASDAVTFDVRILLQSWGGSNPDDVFGTTQV